MCLPVCLESLEEFFRCLSVAASYESSRWFRNFWWCASEERRTVEIDVKASVIRETEKVKGEIPALSDTRKEVGADETEIDNGCSAGIASLVEIVMEVTDGIA